MDTGMGQWRRLSAGEQGYTSVLRLSGD